MNDVATTKTIDIRTAIPGPRSAEILARKQRVIANAKTIVLPIVAQEGRGATLTDVDGNVFIDFTGGVGCLNVGHAHPRVIEAATEQLARFTHTDFTVVPYEAYVELAERLLRLLPENMKRVFYSDSGSAAVEIALKQSFQYWQLTGHPEKTKFVHFDNAYHGDTLGAVAVGGIDVFHKVFGPLLIHSIAVRSPYVAPWSVDAGQGMAFALAELCISSN